MSVRRALVRVGLPLVMMAGVGTWLLLRPAPSGEGPWDRPRSLRAPPATNFPEHDTTPWESLRTELVLADAREPGLPLVIWGYVHDADGAAAPGVRILVYQADAGGDYGQHPQRRTWARLSGVMKTDSLGLYRIVTVKPGSYGGPAHVHFVVGGDGRGLQRAHELHFASDPASRTSLDAAPDTGLLAIVRPEVVDASGIHYMRRDFRLR